jgi:hypothetical protein
MNKYKNSVVTFISTGIIIATLAGCTGGSLIPIARPIEPQPDTPNDFSNSETETYILEDAELLRYSNSGYLGLNYMDFDLTHPERNPTFKESGIEIKVTPTIDNHGPDKIEITYVKDQGILLINGGLNTIPDKFLIRPAGKEVKQYLKQGSRLPDGTVSFEESDSFPADALVLSLEPLFEKDVTTSLEQIILEKTGQPADFTDYTIDANELGVISLNGPGVERILEGNNSYTQEPGKPATGEFYYTYSDSEYHEYAVQVSLQESPYFDIDTQELVINWVISEPINLN